MAKVIGRDLAAVQRYVEVLLALLQVSDAAEDEALFACFVGSAEMLDEDLRMLAQCKHNKLVNRSLSPDCGQPIPALCFLYVLSVLDAFAEAFGYDVGAFLRVCLEKSEVVHKALREKATSGDMN